MGTGISNEITLTQLQAHELKNLLKYQISAMKDSNIPDAEISTRLHSFYGFHTHKKPTIKVVSESGALCYPKRNSKKSTFIDFDPDNKIAASIYSIYHAQGLSDDDIRRKMVDFKGYLHKLDKELKVAEHRRREQEAMDRKSRLHRGEVSTMIKRVPTADSGIKRVGTSDMQVRRVPTVEAHASLRRTATGETQNQVLKKGVSKDTELSMLRPTSLTVLPKVTQTVKKKHPQFVPSSANISGRISIDASASDEKPADARDKAKRKAPLPSWRPSVESGLEGAVDASIASAVSADSADGDEIDGTEGRTDSTEAQQLQYIDEVVLPVLEEEVQFTAFLCRLCGMSFKTEGTLSRHVEYSTMHASILEGYLCCVFDFYTDKSSTDGDEEDDVLPTYSLLMTHSKLFWRTQETIIIDFYVHPTLNCLELVIENSKDETRCTLNFDYHLLCANVHRQFGQMKTVRAFNESLASFIIERLVQDKLHHVIKYKPAFMDRSDIAPLLDAPPASITRALDLECKINRSSSSVEIDAAVENLLGEKHGLQAEVSKAERYSTFTSQAIDEVVRMEPLMEILPDLVKQVSFGLFSPSKHKVFDWRSPLSTSTKEIRLSADRELE